MVIIFNLGGLLIGILGLVVGLILTLLTGNFGLGLLVVGAIWLRFGRRRIDEDAQEVWPAPSLFFIPLFFWAFPVILIGLVAGLLQVFVGTIDPAPREIARQPDRDLPVGSPTDGAVAPAERNAEHPEEVSFDEAEPAGFHDVSGIPSHLAAAAELPVADPALHLKKSMEELNSSDPRIVREAARQIVRLAPTEDAETVLKALRPHMDSADRYTREYAANAFCRWSTSEHIETLEELLESDRESAHAEAGKALARIGDPHTVDVLVTCLSNVWVRDDAERALINMGEAAELPVLQRFVSEDDWEKMTALKIIQRIGGIRSVAPLLQLAEDDARMSSRAAMTATEVFKRLAAPLQRNLAITPDLFLISKRFYRQLNLVEVIDNLTVRVRTSVDRPDELVSRNELLYIPGLKSDVAATTPRLEPRKVSPVLKNTKLMIGQKLQAHRAGRWLDATVVEFHEGGDVKIHWKGYSSGFDRFVPRTELRFYPEDTPVNNTETE